MEFHIHLWKSTSAQRVKVHPVHLALGSSPQSGCKPCLCCQQHSREDGFLFQDVMAMGFIDQQVMVKYDHKGHSMHSSMCTLTHCVMIYGSMGDQPGAAYRLVCVSVFWCAASVLSGNLALFWEGQKSVCSAHRSKMMIWLTVAVQLPIIKAKTQFNDNQNYIKQRTVRIKYNKAENCHWLYVQKETSLSIYILFSAALNFNFHNIAATYTNTHF